MRQSVPFQRNVAVRLAAEAADASQEIPSLAESANLWQATITVSPDSVFHNFCVVNER